MASFAIDMSGLRRAMTTLQRMTGKPMGEIIRRQMNILCYTLAHKVYVPKNRKQGEKKLTADIRKAIRVDRGAGWKESVNKALAKRIHLLVRRKNLVALNKIYENAGAKRIFVPFSPDRHKSRRIITSKGVIINRPNPREVTLDQQPYNAYLKQVSARVGRLKAGWLPAWLATLGAGGQRMLAGWITRHQGQARGTVADRLTDPKRPWVSATNNAPGAARFAPSVKKTLQIRARAMINDFKHQLRRAGQAAKMK
jgi:hypothetical protein